MKKTLFLYALTMAGAAFFLQWLQIRTLVHLMPTQVYIALIAVAFTALGLWAGHYLTQRPKGNQFTKNVKALRALGLTTREYEVLEHLAADLANKEIARQLGVSPNTVKTHLARLYDKLSVQRRTQAVHRAKALALIP